VTTQWSPSRLGNLSGKRIIVTGATNGVGLGTARLLARAGAPVSDVERAYRDRFDPSSVKSLPLSGSPSRGPDDAPVTIVEFADLECPYCARAEESLRQVTERYGADVRVVWKNMPLAFHDHAELAAQRHQVLVARLAAQLDRVPGMSPQVVVTGHPHHGAVTGPERAQRPLDVLDLLGQVAGHQQPVPRRAGRQARHPLPVSRMGHVQITDSQKPSRHGRGIRHADWDVFHRPGRARRACDETSVTPGPADAASAPPTNHGNVTSWWS